MLRAVKGEVPLPLLLSVGLFESDRVVAEQNVQTKGPKHDPGHDHSHCDHDHGHCDHDDHGHHSHSHDHSHSHHSHGQDEPASIEGFTSLSFRSDKPLGLRKFQNFLDNQLPAEVFRAKGILWFNESERRHVFHLAGKRFSIDDTDWETPRSNQMVLIGRGLNHKRLRQQLQACVAPDAGKGFA